MHCNMHLSYDKHSTYNHPQNILRLFLFTPPFPQISMLKRQHILIRACCASKTPTVSLGVKFIALDDKTKQYYARKQH